MDKQSNLQPEIRDIWTDAFRYHATFENMGNTYEDWHRCAKTMESLVNKHNGHPLAGILMMAVYDYLDKQRRKRPEQLVMEAVSSG